MLGAAEKSRTGAPSKTTALRVARRTVPKWFSFFGDSRNGLLETLKSGDIAAFYLFGKSVSVYSKQQKTEKQIHGSVKRKRTNGVKRSSHHASLAESELRNELIREAEEMIKEGSEQKNAERPYPNSMSPPASVYKNEESDSQWKDENRLSVQCWGVNVYDPAKNYR
jgi:hypothetical protein